MTMYTRISVVILLLGLVSTSAFAQGYQQIWAGPASSNPAGKLELPNQRFWIGQNGQYRLYNWNSQAPLDRDKLTFLCTQCTKTDGTKDSFSNPNGQPISGAFIPAGPEVRQQFINDGAISNTPASQAAILAGMAGVESSGSIDPASLSGAAGGSGNLGGISNGAPGNVVSGGGAGGGSGGSGGSGAGSGSGSGLAQGLGNGGGPISNLLARVKQAAQKLRSRFGGSSYGGGSGAGLGSGLGGLGGGNTPSGGGGLLNGGGSSGGCANGQCNGNALY